MVEPSTANRRNPCHVLGEKCPVKNSTPLCISSIKAEWLSFFRAWQKALSVTFLSATSEPETALQKLSSSFCMEDFKRFMRNNKTVLNERLRFLLKSFDDFFDIINQTGTQIAKQVQCQLWGILDFAQACSSS